MDEFDGAYDVNLLRTQIPYRDFHPYKTVLGYYIQLPALVLVKNLWNGLMAVKCQMALINTFMMLVTAFVLSRRNRRISVIISLAILCCMSTYLEHSSDLRVDMLTAWAGMGSLLFLLHQRNGRAGMLAAISFLISQKGIYFLVGANAALLVLGFAVNRKRQAFSPLIRFNAVAAIIMAAYIIAWSWLASFDSVINTIFFSHRDIAFGYLYDIRLEFWLQTLRRNPFFYAMAAFSLALIAWSIFSKIIRKRQIPNCDLILLVYGTIIMVAGIWHHQPWPYFFVILIPTIFVLHIRGFGYIFAKKRLMLSASPFILGLSIVGFGILYPLTRLDITLRRDSGFQKNMVNLGSHILNEGETYLAGMDLIYSHKQYPQRLRRLDSARLEWLKRLSVKDITAIIQELEQDPPKLLFENYRTQQFPVFLKTYLDRHYLPFWGCLKIYAPMIDDCSREFSVGFSGTYRILLANIGSYEVPAPHAAVSIDEHVYQNGESVELNKGLHLCGDNNSFRLVLIPKIADDLKESRYKPSIDLYPDIYAY